MQVSLVVTTLGRVDELETLLASVVKQTYKNVQVVVVDQNEDDRLAPVIDRYQNELDLQRCRSSRGAARGRNEGLKHVRGERGGRGAGGQIIGFPDDDCVLPDDLVANVVDLFEQDSTLGAATGRIVDFHGQSTISRFAQSPGPVRKNMIWRQVIEATIFVRQSALGDVRFDPDMGVGAPTPWGADEGPDFILQLIGQGVRAEYRPDRIAMRHPDPVPRYDAAARRRAFSYGAGMGHLIRKHRYPLHILIYALLRPAGGAILALARGRVAKARYHLQVAAGRAYGWSGRKAMGP